MNTKTNQTKYKVLIVDDDKLYRETLVAMLSDTYLCAVAADATTVLKACQSQIAPDLILLDFRLQKESGIEVCQHHFPVAHVASEFPELCEAEAEVMSRLLGTHVQRLATIANGDGVCTTFVPTITPQAARKPLAVANSSRKSEVKGARR